MSSVQATAPLQVGAASASDRDALPVHVDLCACTDVDAVVAAARAHIDRHLHTVGGVLFRTEAIDGLPAFERFVEALGQDLMRYDFGSTPRSQLLGRVYSSTEYPAEHAIALHNEMAYTTRWPSRIWFYCDIAPEQGGETPIADSRAIYRRIDPAIRRRFEERELLYVRNYRPGLDVPWQQTFNTGNKADVERYCRDADIGFEWRGDDELKTWQRCQSVLRHPATGEMVWFNQAHVFHVSSLEPEYREALREMYAEDELPRNVLYGDGGAIGDDVLDEVRAAIEAEKRLFPWRKGDVLMLDNLLVAHGREPFSGARRIAVAMA
mgnify:CR=1 FL=1